MRRIELRLLRSFVSIYERRSLSAAARHTSRSQTAMSIRLKMLEDEIGHVLFDPLWSNGSLRNLAAETR